MLYFLRIFFLNCYCGFENVNYEHKLFQQPQKMRGADWLDSDEREDGFTSCKTVQSLNDMFLEREVRG